MFSNINFERVLAFGDCSICHDEMLGKPALAHGKCEPFHETCLKAWLEVRKTCPLCVGTVDVDSLFSWKERALTPLKLMAKDALIGLVATTGIVAGTAVAGTAIAVGAAGIIGVGEGARLAAELAGLVVAVVVVMLKVIKLPDEELAAARGGITTSMLALSVAVEMGEIGGIGEIGEIGRIGVLAGGAISGAIVVGIIARRR